MTFNANDTAAFRFGPREIVTVVSCNGCVAIIRAANGEIYPVPIGYLTRA